MKISEIYERMPSLNGCCTGTGLLDGFLASIPLDSAPFCNPHN